MLHVFNITAMKWPNYFLILMLLVCFSCEKVVIADEDLKKQEQTDKSSSGDSSDDKSGGKSGDEGSAGGKDSDADKDGGDQNKDNQTTDKDGEGGNTDDSDWDEVDTSDKDSYEEKDITDGDKDTGEDRETRHTVEYFLTEKHLDGGVWVVGYIVGTSDKNSAKAAGSLHLAPPFTTASNILLADSPNETDVNKMMSVELPQGALRNKFNLKDHPENLHRKAEFHGYREEYLKILGMKSPGSSGWAE